MAWPRGIFRARRTPADTVSFWRPTQQVPRERDIPRPQPDAQSHVIEGEILDFCGQHADEPFCTHLLDYLRKHGMTPP